MKEKYKNIYQKIDSYFNKMRLMRPISQQRVNRFIEDFSISTCHNSTAIEGNTFTYDETMLLLKDGVTNSAHSITEHNEIIGYKKAFDYLYKAVKENVIISEEFIKKIHSFVILGQESAGEYRDIQVYIGDLFQAKYTTPAPSLLNNLMNNYVKDIKKDSEYIQEIMTEENMDWVKLFHL
ncbi:MAG: hypothetical protein PHS19_03940, partial [Eubacteriales bacterium]|nr:hypothetical protein [Eubacteriales bacterium]